MVATTEEGVFGTGLFREHFVKEGIWDPLNYIEKSHPLCASFVAFITSYFKTISHLLSCIYQEFFEAKACTLFISESPVSGARP